MAELNRGWLATVLTADSNLEIGTGLASTLRRHTNQLADAFTIENSEWVLLENAFG
jgi:hypothetical protein